MEVPWVEPEEFDIVIAGTGLAESIAASAAAHEGKSVLQLDECDIYGGAYAGLTAGHMRQWALATGQSDSREVAEKNRKEEGGNCVEMEYRLGELWAYSGGEEIGDFERLEGKGREFIMDIANCRFPYCDDPFVECLLRSGAHKYFEFKPIEAAYFVEAPHIQSDDRISEGCEIPSSRQAIFRHPDLSLLEKRQLTRFISSVMSEELRAEGRGEGSGLMEFADQRHLNLEDEVHGNEEPFEEYLQEWGLDSTLANRLCYGLALADTPMSLPAGLGVTRFRRYVRSTGRFGHGQGAFLLPLFGIGDLCQGFCRNAAVHGAIHCLGCPPKKVHRTEGGTLIVTTSRGQEIGCKGLIACETYFASRPSNNSVSAARGCLAVRGSLFEDRSQALAILPPGALGQYQSASVRLVQMTDQCGVCPDGFTLVHAATRASAFASPCDAKAALRDAVASLARKAGAEVAWGVIFIQQSGANGGVSELFPQVASIPLPTSQIGLQEEVAFAKRALEIACPSASFFPSPPSDLDDGSLPGEEEAFQHLNRVMSDGN